MRLRRFLPVVAAVFLWHAPGAFAAGWCGSGEATADRTDIVTGRQIHPLVVLPSDAPDDFAVDAGRLADDAASVTSWWVGQDPTREPRFDDATFGASTCLDVSLLRLPVPAASLTGATAVFGDIASALTAGGFASPYKDYLVYYDGPAPEANVCGVGDGTFDTGPGLAVVFLAGCPVVPTDTVLAHELLHALGAVPPGDPHPCPGDAGHPCDSPTDVLYPVTHGEPLSQKVLDFNHDDYYGHSGSWPDIQDSLFLRHLDTSEEQLSVAFAGAGTVVSDVPGVDCSAACATQWDQSSTLTLTAKPAPGDRFVGWRGGCKGVGGCFVTLTAPLSATAVFGPLRIPVRVSVAGRGRVACSPRCSHAFRAGAALTLRAVAAKGWRFARWSGGCSGTRPVCRPATDFALAVRAVFHRG